MLDVFRCTKQNKNFQTSWGNTGFSPGGMGGMLGMNCSRFGGEKSGMCLCEGPALNLRETSVSKIHKINAQNIMKAESCCQNSWRFSRIKYNLFYLKVHHHILSL